MIKIVYDSEQTPEEGLVAFFERVAELAAEREGLTDSDYEVSLLFAEPEEIRRLNEQYRGIDESTDVLSFPMLEASADDSAGPSLALILLGDVVICGEIAKKQAGEYGHSEERELVFLFTHGLLHLLGYDHEQGGDAAMRAAEKEILDKMGLSN